MNTLLSAKIFIFTFIISTHLSAADGSGWRIAIIDSGINANDTQARTKTVRQGCFGTLDATVDINGVLYWREAHTCREEQFSIGSKYAYAPRKVTRLRGNITDIFYFGYNHGTVVANAAENFAKKASFETYNIARHIGCGISPGETSPESCKKYPVKSLLDALKEIRPGRKIAAVNISFGHFGSSSQLSCNQFLQERDYKLVKNEIDRIVRSGIAVVAATGNSSTRERSNRTFFPACLSNVISVAGVNANNTLYFNSNTTGGIDFWAPNFSNFNGARYTGTSYSAPRVAAAFAILKEAKPSASINEIKRALSSANNVIFLKDPRNGASAPIVNRAIIDSAISILKGSPSSQNPPPGNSSSIPLNTDGEFFSTLGAQNEPLTYPFSISSNAINSTQIIDSETTALQSARVSSLGGTYRLTFEGTHISQNELTIRINNRALKRSDPSPYAHESSPPRWKRFTIDFRAQDFLKIGDNELMFQPHHPASYWGIRNVKIEALPGPTITLIPGRTNTTTYGYGIGTNKHITQLTARFTKPNYDVVFSLQGWDIDVGDESGVYLNGRRLGYQNISPSSNYNGGTSFIILQNQMVTGTNTIQLRQKTPDGSFSGFEDEKWGVRNMLIKEYVEPTAGIAPIIMLLLDDED